MANGTLEAAETDQSVKDLQRGRAGGPYGMQLEDLKRCLQEDGVLTEELTCSIIVLL